MGVCRARGAEALRYSPKYYKSVQFHTKTVSSLSHQGVMLCCFLYPNHLPSLLVCSTYTYTVGLPSPPDDPSIIIS